MVLLKLPKNTMPICHVDYLLLIMQAVETQPLPYKKCIQDGKNQTERIIICTYYIIRLLL